MEKPRNRRPDALGVLQHLPDEVLSRIVGLLAPKDVGSMACVSSIFYVFCSEEPLWMNLCLDNHEGLLEYKGSWKLTTLDKMGLVKNGTTAFDKAPMHFNGFTSLYLYRRWYRCHMALEAFIIPGVLERREKVTQKEFDTLYDGKRPVLLTDLTEDWPAKDSWSIPRLVEKFGDIAFKVGQSHGKKVTMKFKDYASYMTQQHDEDPLYIFDSKFGKHAPALLEDYKVPYLFTEDYLELLGEQRPPFRWLVIGPCRSGASWHVDPGLTSAWNTLLCGRKRWALYPPGRVPPRVTVHVDEEDGDVNFDGPTSLQWWVDVYPSLKDEDKPIECIQYPGETIYVPSGWWHCVLNIDSSVAVTQNFVNSANFELVCLDMAPGFRHKGIARAGNMALGQAPFTPKYETVAKSVRTSAVKPTSQPVGNLGVDCNRQPVSETDGLGTLSSKLIEPVGQEDMIAPENQLDECSPLDINTLLAHTEEHPDHFNSNTSGNYLGQRVLRRWLRKLWTDRPELQPRIWQCACRVLDAETWVYRAISICEAYGFPTPSGLERLPVGNGSNPVFVIGEKVIKFYVEEGLEGSVDVLGSELEFYAQVIETGSPLKHVIPALVGSGILYPDGDKFRAVAWNGTGDVPPAEGTGMARKRARDPERHEGRVRTKWSRSAKRNPNVSESGSKNLLFCPYIVMERCSGKSLLSMLGDLKSDDMLALASFLGQQVRNLHSLSLPSEILYQGNLGSEGMSKHLKGEGPPPTVTGVDREAARLEVMSVEHHVTTSACPPEAESKWPLQVPWEWQNFVSLLREKREHISDQFDEWATIPDHLVKQVETYLPQDPATIIDFIQVEGNVAKSLKPPVWIHMDIMVDNVLMRQSSSPTNTNGETNADSGAVSTSQVLSHTRTEASHIIDFGDINFGDPVYEFIAVYLDVFRGDVQLMKRFLKEYQLPFWVQTKDATTTLSRPRPSYKAMCYVLLYRIRPGRVLMHIKESLQKAKSWEDIEEQVFGFLNDWQQESLLSSSLTTATSTATDLLP